MAKSHPSGMEADMTPIRLGKFTFGQVVRQHEAHLYRMKASWLSGSRTDRFPCLFLLSCLVPSYFTLLPAPFSILIHFSCCDKGTHHSKPVSHSLNWLLARVWEGFRDWLACRRSWPRLGNIDLSKSSAVDRTMSRAFNPSLRKSNKNSLLSN